MPESKSSLEVPVALLSQALVELRTARGNREAEREAAIRYFKSGIAEGYQIGPLLDWLCFWPNNRESVFWQARLDSKFVEMLKKLSLRDLGMAAKCAPPNDGPAERTLSSEAGSGPASVSRS